MNYNGRLGPVAVIGLSLLGVAIKLCIYYAVSPGALSYTTCQWDCNWYISLAKNGYDATPHVVGAAIQTNWAFFPVYPLALVLVRHFTNVSFQSAGLLSAIIAEWGFIWLGCLYRSRTRANRASSGLWIAVAVAWPYGLYFDVPYSESCYAFFATACLFALASGRDWLFATASVFLTACRPTGILLAIWFAAQHLVSSVRTHERLFLRAGPVLVAPLGL